MAIDRMKSYIIEKRSEFGEVLRDGGHVFMDFMKECLEECCGEFDEKCLMENLREEYELFLKEVQS